VRETLTGRLLAAGLLAGTLALAWLQDRSPLARSLKEGRPVLGWLDLQGEGPGLFLAVYQPMPRTLDIVHVGIRGVSRPDEAARRLAALAPDAGIAEGLPVWSGPLARAAGAPPLDAADWVARRLHDPRSWLRRPAGDPGPDWPLFDRLLLALELLRLDPESLRPAWLPPDIQAGGLLNRLILGAETMPGPEKITVEVLNSTERSGVASRAKNILRLGGADVMSVGNAVGTGRTVVYDRTGRFESAAAVRRMLGCPAARAVTQVDLRRLVDVSVVLAEDCPLP
jgi:hypothetical protein